MLQISEQDQRQMILDLWCMKLSICFALPHSFTASLLCYWMAKMLFTAIMTAEKCHVVLNLWVSL